MKKISAVQFIFLYMLISLIYGCSFQKMGASAAKGVSSQSDSIGNALVRGAMNQLTDPYTQKKIRQFVDSIISSATDTLTYKTMAMRDSLINSKLIIWADSLLEAVTGNQMRLNMEKIQLALIGKTKSDVLDMKYAFRDLLNQVLSVDTRSKLSGFRDELLGDKTNRAFTKIADSLVSHIVDSAIVRLAYRYRTDLSPEFRTDIGFVNKNAKSLLILMGAIACIIIFLVWRSRVRYLKLTTLLTKHINGIPDQNIYDTVTANIKNDALTIGLEGQLRDLLAKNGLLGTDDWKSQASKVKNHTHG
ncbi:MAG: hypothetical protein M3N30_00185 [Bacteroidota bacterium]|nr:hypothetical protein [Bacteroidota bacterium]